MVGPEEDADVLVAVQGCPTACADLSSFDGSRVLHIKDEEELHLLIAKLFDDQPI